MDQGCAYSGREALVSLTFKWVDGHREPKEKPNPAYPLGIDVDMSHGAAKSCKTSLPYPTPRCGYYLINCTTCGYTVAVTTAGRVDDPRSIKVPCYGHASGATRPTKPS
jgi:hypothetical protein